LFPYLSGKFENLNSDFSFPESSGVNLKIPFGVFCAHLKESKKFFLFGTLAFQFSV